MSRVGELGGPESVQRIVGAFIDRCMGDFVIGFLFAGSDRDRIVRHETEMALRMLGEDIPYTGRPLAVAHRPKRINQGHYRRRQAILRHVLGEQGVADDVVELWAATCLRTKAAG
jgi:hypothetical protein